MVGPIIKTGITSVGKRIGKEVIEEAVESTVKGSKVVGDKRTKDIKDLEQQKKADPVETEPVVTIEEEAAILDNNTPPEPPGGGGTPPPGGSSGDPDLPGSQEILFGKDGIVKDVKENTPDRFLYTYKNIQRVVEELDDAEFEEILKLKPVQLEDLKKVLKEAEFDLPPGFGEESFDRISNVVVSSKKLDVKSIKTVNEVNDYVDYMLKRITKAFEREGVDLGKTKYSMAEMVEQANEIPQAEAVRAALAKPGGVSFINSADMIKMSVIENELYKNTLVAAKRLTNLGKKIKGKNTKEIQQQLDEATLQYESAVKIFAYVENRNTRSASELGRMLYLRGKVTEVLKQPNKNSNIMNSVRKELNNSNAIAHADFLLKASADQKSGKVFISRTYDKLMNGKFGLRQMSGAWVQSLLGSVHMHIANFVENFANSNLLFMLEMVPGALIGNARNLARKAFQVHPWTRNIFKTKTDYAQFRDIITTFHAEAHSLGNAIKNSRKSFVKNRPIDPLTKLYQSERELFVPTTDPDRLAKQSKGVRLYNKMLHTLVNMPGRAMTSADEFFATKLFNREALIQIGREIDDIILKTGDVEKAKVHARNRIEEFDTAFADDILRDTRKALYKDEGKLSDPSVIEKGIDNFVRAMNNPIVKTQIPFGKVYINIMAQVMKRTPAAFATPGFYRDLARGGRHTDMAIGRLMFGTTILSMGAYAANGQFREDNNMIIVGHIPKFRRTTKDSKIKYSLQRNYENMGLDKEKTIYIKKEGEETFRDAKRIPLRSLGILGELLSMGADYSMCVNYSDDLGALTKYVFCAANALYNELGSLPYIDAGNSILDLAYVRDSNEITDKLGEFVVEKVERPIGNSLLQVGTGGIVNVGFWNSIDRMWVKEGEEVAPRDYTVNDYDVVPVVGESTDEALQKALRHVLNTFEATPFVDEQTRRRDRFGRTLDHDRHLLEFRISKEEKPSYNYSNYADVTPENDPVTRQLFDDNIATYVDAPLRVKNVKLTKYERQIYHYRFTTEPLEVVYKNGTPIFPGKGPMTWYDTLNELFTGDSEFSQLYRDTRVMSLKEEFNAPVSATRNKIVAVLEQQFTQSVEKYLLDPNNGNLYYRIQYKRGK
jgi:hypothetical protein